MAAATSRSDGFTGPWDTSAPLDKYLVRARRAGIERTVVFSAFHSDYAVANRRVAEGVAAHPDRLIGFAFVKDHIRCAPLALVLVMLVIYALDVPLVIALTVARYASPAGHACSLSDIPRRA